MSAWQWVATGLKVCCLLVSRVFGVFEDFCEIVQNTKFSILKHVRTVFFYSTRVNIVFLHRKSLQHNQINIFWKSKTKVMTPNHWWKTRQRLRKHEKIAKNQQKSRKITKKQWKYVFLKNIFSGGWTERVQKIMKITKTHRKSTFQNEIWFQLKFYKNRLRNKKVRPKYEKVKKKTRFFFFRFWYKQATDL